MFVDNLRRYQVYLAAFLINEQLAFHLSYHDIFTIKPSDQVSWNFTVPWQFKYLILLPLSDVYQHVSLGTNRYSLFKKIIQLYIFFLVAFKRRINYLLCLQIIDFFFQKLRIESALACRQSCLRKYFCYCHIVEFIPLTFSFIDFFFVF